MEDNKDQYQQDDQMLKLKTFSAYEKWWRTEHPERGVVGPEFSRDISEHAERIENFDWYN